MSVSKQCLTAKYPTVLNLDIVNLKYTDQNPHATVYLQD